MVWPSWQAGSLDLEAILVSWLPALMLFPALGRQLTVALLCTGLDGMGNELKEIRWDGSHVSLAYDTHTLLIPALLAAHGKDVAAKFCIGPVAGNLEPSWAHSCQTLP